MLRAIVAISQRGNVSKALLTPKGLDHSIWKHIKIGQSPLLSRPIVRSFASGDNKIKGGPTGINQGGIIGNLGSTTSTGSDPVTTAQAQTATTMGNDVTPDSGHYGKQSNYSEKLGAITSQMHATPSLTECGKIGTDESAANAKITQRKKTTTKEVGKSGQPDSGSSFSDDAVKHVQDMAANLPSKQQVEKFFFRVVAFIYDITFLTANWTIRFVDQKIVQNASVQHYWKRFHEKMEQAKKD